MKLYGLKNCDTCRKAKKALEAAGHEVEFNDVRATSLDADLLTYLLDHFGEEKLLNKKSTTWRQLDPQQREQPALELLLAHPALMKRPVIIHNGEKFVGWTKDTQSLLL